MMSVKESLKQTQQNIGKYVYTYKTLLGDVDLSDGKGNIRFFDSPEEARKAGGNRPCWKVSRINKVEGYDPNTETINGKEI